MSTVLESASGGDGGAISLDHLIALNDEVVALVRAGVPLERGLLGAGRDLPGRLGAATSALGQRMSRGDSLPQALAAEGSKFPHLYRAVVEAGLRAGRLSVALEGLAAFARSYAELRRAIGLALLYPLMVLSFAYGLFLFFVVQVAPRLASAYESLRVPIHGALTVLVKLGETALYWGPILPALLLVVVFWWYQSGRSAWLGPGRGGWLVRRLPWMRAILASTEAANFAELLALLLEHNVPFHHAVALAAEASGDPSMVEASREIGSASERGESIRDSMAAARAFPPLLRWMIVTGQRQGTLVTALRHAAETYRRRALHHAELIRVFLPVVLLLLVGATATLLFGLTLFLPLTSLLKNLSSL